MVVVVSVAHKLAATADVVVVLEVVVILVVVVVVIVTVIIIVIVALFIFKLTKDNSLPKGIVYMYHPTDRIIPPRVFTTVVGN